MNSLEFAHPEWLYLFWVITAVAGALLFLVLRSNTILNRFIAPQMQQRLVRSLSTPRRIAALVLTYLSLLVLLVAIMRPQYGGEVQQLTSVQSQIMVCLDVSKSMLAEDVVPNRLGRAKAEIDTLLSLLDPSQQVGLMVFAGKSSLVSPLTTDHAFLRLLLQDVGPHSVGLGGTKIGDALRTSTEAFRTAGDINRLILLVTDGEDHDSFPVEAAAQAREKGVRVVSIGFGDESGSKIEITNPQTGEKEFVTDRDGQPVISRLDGETLREIAIQTEGAYVPAGVGQLDLKAIYEEHIERMLAGSTEQQTRIIKQEAYHFFVLAAILLWLAAQILNVPWLARRPLRAGAGAVIAVYCCLSSPATVSAARLAVPALIEGEDGIAASADKSDVAKSETEKVSSTPPADRTSDETESESVLESVLTPRERYNLAITALRRGEDRAEEMLEDVRSDAGVDGELRFRSTYNLGCFSAAKAQKLAPEQPGEALKFMQQAISRFREAVRLRPDSDLARQNLELASREVLVLQDRLSQQESGSVEEQLDDLIQQMRSHENELMSTVGGFDASPVDQRTRSAFRRLGTTQREVIATTEKLLEAIVLESQSPSKPNSQSHSAADSEDETKLRAEQLKRAAEYLQLSANWLQKSRSMTRRILPKPAFLRWSAAIGEARRARDQLRPPTEILQALVKDTSRILRLSELAARPESPQWLTAEYLYDEQNRDAERTEELRELFASVAEQLSAPSSNSQLQSPSGSGTQPQAQDEAQREFTLAAYSKASEHLSAATSAMRTAAEQLRDDEVTGATASQRQALLELTSAAEYFLPLKQLIDVTARQQFVIESLHTQPKLDSVNEEIAELQQINLRRSARLKKLLQQEADTLEESIAQDPTAQNPAAANASPQQSGSGVESSKSDELEQQQQRIQYAQALLAEAELAMQEVAKLAVKEENQIALQPDGLQVAAPVDSPPPRPTGSPPNVDFESPPESSFGPHNIAADRMRELQRLFFTLLEHLKDTARQQSELNENTQTLAAKVVAQPDDPASTLAAKQNELAFEQSQLQGMADAIANALAEQAESAAAQPSQPPAGASPSDGNTAGASSGPSAEDLSQASDLVAEASQAQMEASEHIQPDSPEATEALTPALQSADETESGEENESASGTSAASDANNDPLIEILARGQERQQTALAKLIEAIQILEPNQQDQQDDQQNQNQAQQNETGDDQQPKPDSSENSQDDQNQADESSDAPDQQAISAQQLLDMIRNRDAERRKAKQAQATRGGTDRDW